MNRETSDGLVFFGATGDLAFKQIFPALQGLAKRGRLEMPIVAVGRKPLDKPALLQRVKESLQAGGGVDGPAFESLSRRLAYAQVDYDDPGSFTRIRDALGNAKHPLHYVALPPDVFEKVAANLAAAGLARGARLVLEKPFGHDAASAKALSEALHSSFPEEAIFRIDHYLGKETVENIVYFRAANPLFEGAFDAEHIESVQITMAETFGVRGRAAFYDGVGAIRDVVQNHLLEVVACLALELPEEGGHEALRGQRCKLLAEVNPVSPVEVVRGQFRGYKDEEGVNEGSTTETFAALRLTLDGPRWQGVPFFLRAGKSLAVTATEAVVTWKTRRSAVFDEPAPHAKNQLRFRLGPDAGIALAVNVKKPGEAMAGEVTELAVRRSGRDELKPYERLLGDAMMGQPAFFAGQREAEHSWRIVDEVLRQPVPARTYEPGSWGPRESDAVAPPGGWVNPRS
ncbi:MAG: glucose-6-phosphate dehydrogenase [Myxococcota bacterium]|nr:glucose-6-phosphate dehydrogenase [Myxococcota bacterium]